MEPTILKTPSIYKGAGIYKTGAEGGGGGGGYTYIQIDNLLWTDKNLNLNLGVEGTEQFTTTFPEGGKVYTLKLLLEHLQEIEIDGWRIPNKSDWDSLISYITGQGQNVYQALVTNDSQYAGTPGQDLYGMNIQCVGYSYPGLNNMTGVGGTCNFWTKSVYSGSSYYDYNFNSGSSSWLSHDFSQFMLSVRLCKDA